MDGRNKTKFVLTQYRQHGDDVNVAMENEQSFTRSYGREKLFDSTLVAVSKELLLLNFENGFPLDCHSTTSWS